MPDKDYSFYEISAKKTTATLLLPKKNICSIKLIMTRVRPARSNNFYFEF